ncbi:MAG: hypothetical protein LBJ96_01255 [Holosporaceae bacterium]|jgi:beta-lactamase superfamily II metal-dependent hydrolase|nr:hypothetical protein [Holosporaceae bacterium]
MKKFSVFLILQVFFALSQFSCIAVGIHAFEAGEVMVYGMNMGHGAFFIQARIVDGQRKLTFVDCGSTQLEIPLTDSVLCSFLNGVFGNAELTNIVITHPHSDHYDKLAQMLEYAAKCGGFKLADCIEVLIGTDKTATLPPEGEIGSCTEAIKAYNKVALSRGGRVCGGVDIFLYNNRKDSGNLNGFCFRLNGSGWEIGDSSTIDESWDNHRIEFKNNIVLYGSKNSGSDRINSLSLIVLIEGMLYSGDLDDGANLDGIESFFERVIVVGLVGAHHGSSSHGSPSVMQRLCKAAQPKFVIFPVGRNSKFGHPDIWRIFGFSVEKNRGVGAEAEAEAEAERKINGLLEIVYPLKRGLSEDERGAVEEKIRKGKVNRTIWGILQRMELPKMELPEMESPEMESPVNLNPIYLPLLVALNNWINLPSMTRKNIDNLVNVFFEKEIPMLSYPDIWEVNQLGENILFFLNKVFLKAERQKQFLESIENWNFSGDAGKQEKYSFFQVKGHEIIFNGVTGQIAKFPVAVYVTSMPQGVPAQIFRFGQVRSDLTNGVRIWDHENKGWSEIGTY